MNATNITSVRPMSQFLRMAIMAGVESAVQIHIDRGDDLNARDANGMTPLMLSAARNKPSICKLLLSGGADHRLLAPSGQTALEIAIVAGSNDTAVILAAVHGSTASTSTAEIAFEPASPDSASVIERSQTDGPDTPSITEAPETSFATEVLAAPPQRKPTLPLAVVIDMDAQGEFDLSGWEAEEEPARPEADLAILDTASAIQEAITSHKPVDSSAEWDDIEAYLPEVALPLARMSDTEGRALLRRLLLRAIREGSVPILDVQALSTNEDRSANPEAEAYLAMVVNDLGAEVDERFEYTDASESYEVFVEPEETLDEEAALDDALGAIDRAASPRYEPLRIYQREFQRLRLLTAEEEVQLGQAMEAALDTALDALANWTHGIARTLADSTKAITGLRPLSSIWAGVAESDPEPSSAASINAASASADASDDSMDDDGMPVSEAPGDTSFKDALTRLGTLFSYGEALNSSFREIRQTLAALRLNRRYLLELSDVANGSEPCPEFRHAMTAFRQARDRMTTANLKLAFFQAKKYLFSGEPLDDLAQEGNIGLLKAVDRYDWRRGFRFSTYATWWIRQQIGRYVADRAKTIRLPVHIYEKVQHMERMVETFEAATGRAPNLEKMAEHIEMPAHKIAALLRIASVPFRIDELPIDEMIAIDARDIYSAPDPADVVEKAQLSSAVDRWISSLSTKDLKEERILRLRFGIGVDDVLTLDEIGSCFGVTRERIRQIEAKAIKKLQHPIRSEPFARLVLGLEPEENPFAPTARGPDNAEEPDAAEPALQPSASLQRATSPRQPREPIQPTGSSKPSALDQLLAQAAKLGVPVEDKRTASSGCIWVNLVATPDNQHRRLARKLIEFGFEHSPGKGYWR